MLFSSCQYSPVSSQEAHKGFNPDVAARFFPVFLDSHRLPPAEAGNALERGFLAKESAAFLLISSAAS